MTTFEQQRKILEAAAKACGVKTIAGYDMKKGIPVDTGALRWMQYWNPLTSSADCAEMCAELEIDWIHGRNYEFAEVWLNGGSYREIEYLEKHDNSRLKAWMYAATLVAAKIGGFDG